jgi:hypothetical protein
MYMSGENKSGEEGETDFVPSELTNYVIRGEAKPVVAKGQDGSNTSVGVLFEKDFVGGEYVVVSSDGSDLVSIKIKERQEDDGAREIAEKISTRTALAPFNNRSPLTLNGYDPDAISPLYSAICELPQMEIVSWDQGAVDDLQEAINNIKNEKTEVAGKRQANKTAVADVLRGALSAKAAGVNG